MTFGNEPRLKEERPLGSLAMTGYVSASFVLVHQTLNLGGEKLEPYVELLLRHEKLIQNPAQKLSWTAVIGCINAVGACRKLGRLINERNRFLG
jgi:hypothetical protein